MKSGDEDNCASSVCSSEDIQGVFSDFFYRDTDCRTRRMALLEKRPIALMPQPMFIASQLGACAAAQVGLWNTGAPTMLSVNRDDIRSDEDWCSFAWRRYLNEEAPPSPKEMDSLAAEARRRLCKLGENTTAVTAALLRALVVVIDQAREAEQEAVEGEDGENNAEDRGNIPIAQVFPRPQGGERQYFYNESNDFVLDAMDSVHGDDSPEHRNGNLEQGRQRARSAPPIMNMMDTEAAYSEEELIDAEEDTYSVHSMSFSVHSMPLVHKEGGKGRDGIPMQQGGQRARSVPPIMNMMDTEATYSEEIELHKMLRWKLYLFVGEVWKKRQTATLLDAYTWALYRARYTFDFWCDKYQRTGPIAKGSPPPALRAEESPCPDSCGKSIAPVEGQDDKKAAYCCSAACAAEKLGDAAVNWKHTHMDLLERQIEKLGPNPDKKVCFQLYITALDELTAIEAVLYRDVWTGLFGKYQQGLCAKRDCLQKELAPAELMYGKSPEEGISPPVGRGNATLE